MWQRKLFGLIAALAVACSGTHDDSVGFSTGALSIPGLTPVPCAWDGDSVQILVADAWTGCSAKNGGGFAADFFGNDPYLSQVLQRMMDAGAGAANPFSDWELLRKTKSLNCDPATGEPAAFGVTIPRSVVPEEISIPPGADFTRYTKANGELRQAGVNLCIAQRLRGLAPGASAGESLLLSEADQRLLLETIRERAQVAMLQYALLGVVFSTTPQQLSGTPWVEQRVPILQTYAASNPSALFAMGRDFAAAVQLHSMVSEELLRLFSRSRSARAKRGGTSATRADETWGAGSWHQRMLAAAYGGDPLVVVDDTTPWTHWNPNKHLSGDAGVGHEYDIRYDWPDTLRSPYATVSIDEPQVSELFRQARRFDLLNLAPNAQAGSCAPFDIDASAAALYKSVESELRVADCFKASPTDPCPAVPTLPATDYGQEPYLLWEKHRVTPEHARALAALLAQSLGGRRDTAACNVAAANLTDAQFGARNTSGIVTLQSNGTTHLGKDATFSSMTPWEVAPTFTRNASLRFPSPLDLDPAFGGLWDVTMNALAFDDFCVGSVCNNYKNADAKRLMGSISAQAATREMVVLSVAYLTYGFGQISTLWNYYAQAPQILKLIEAAVGSTTVSVSPLLERVVASGSGLPTTKVTSADGLGSAHSVGMLVPRTDPWWDNTCDAQGCTALTGVVAVRGPWARTLAAHPDATIYGKSLLDLALAPDAAIAVGSSLTPPVELLPKIWVANPLWLPSPPGCTVCPPPPGTEYDPGAVYTLVAFRLDQNAPPDQAVSFRLLGANMKLGPALPRDAQYLAGGGAFGSWVARQSAVRSLNPSEPAIDGFDLPTDWVPPLNAELIGGNAGESSAQVYLKLAKESADTARSAVESALQDLSQKEQDEVAQSVAAAKSAAGTKEERDRLCGSDNPSCDTSFADATIPNPLQDCTATGLQDPELAKCDLDKFAFGLASALTTEPVSLAAPVVQTLGDPSVPAFAAYKGGALQASFVEQWVAMRQMPAKLDLLAKTAAAAKSTVDAAWVALASATAEQQAKCSFEKMQFAELAGFQVKETATSADGTRHFSYDPTKASLAPLLAQVNACETATNALGPAAAATIQARNAAWVEVGAAAVGLIDALGAVHLSAARGAALINEAELAERRNDLEVELTKTSLLTSSSVYRVTRGYDLWRAKALVENSRRYALAARRAIEARYVVNLSELDKGEAFVGSPKSWADEVYGHDLTLPAAVGLTLSGSPKGDAIYPNKLTDYVANLEAFVAGYSVSRPTAVAGNEIDVVTLPGLAAGDPVEIPIDPSDPQSPTITAHPSQGTWLVRCLIPGQPPQWFPLVSPCDGKVDMAKLQFTLDPWGRLNDAVVNPPFEKRFNSRWGLLAVNFVGTGIRDCQNALDPKGCYAEPFIRYNLTHVGPSWVTDFDERWRLLGLPTGRIEGGKALAAEIWLDPLKDGWSTSYISAVARSEWQQRSLGGAYDLEFQVTPDVRLDRIERVQLLIGSTSWVKQQ